MNRFKSLLFIVLSCVIAFNFTACEKTPSAVDFSYFNTVIHVQTHSKALTKSTKTKLENLLSGLENEFDIFNENSIAYKFNNAKNGETLSLSDNAVKIFSQADRAYLLTDGDFNPTVYPLVQLWGFAPFKFSLSFTPPTEDKILEQLQKVDYKGVIFNAEQKTLTKGNDFVKIDLGGIVKGYASDMLSKILLDEGYKDGYVSVGGSSLNLLSVPELSVRHPKNTVGKAIINVNCEGQTSLSVSTSGDYEKYYNGEDGKKYSHIISPKTGRPSSTNVNSVTLIGVDGVLGDALTTGACLKTHDAQNLDGSELVIYLRSLMSEFPSLEVYAVYTDNDTKSILTNKKQGEDFTLLDTSYSVINI